MSYTLVPSELIVDGAITSAKLDTNISISGTLGVTGEVTLATHLNMGDNDKIKIGTGGDLEIYHDGSNSYIANSTGNIYIADTNGAVHIQAKLNEESIVATADGAVTLYHDNSAKLATTSGGITVTGTINDLTLAAGNIETNTSNNLSINTPNSLRINIDSNNSATDQVFIIGHNQTAVDTSNALMTVLESGKVGIGTTSPTAALSVISDNANFSAQISRYDADDGLFLHSAAQSSHYNWLIATQQNVNKGFEIIPSASTGARDFTTPAFVILADTGNVGIGTSNPSRQLTVQNSSDHAVIGAVSGTSSLAGMVMGDTDDDDTGAVLYNNNGNYLYFQTNTSENARLTSDGNLQLGTSIGNSTYAGLFNGVANKGTSGAIIQTRNGDGNKHLILRGDNNVEYGSIGLSSPTGSGALQIQGEDTIVFNTNTNTERMRINANGKVLIGTTSGVRGQEDLSIDAGSDAIVTRTAGAGLIVRKSSFGNGFLCLFENDSATAVGSITSGGSSTVYNTSSDYRLKENIETMQNGLVRLNKLNPVKFTWKETGKESEGFIAHEVNEIFSDCVHGEKDGDEMQGMDYGRITPLLVKAIQEQQTIIEDLKSRIETLEG